MNKTLLIWIAFLVAFLIAGYVTWESANVSFYGEKTQATCVGIEVTNGNKGKKHRYSWIAFADRDGANHEVRMTQSFFTAKPSKGEQVDILYLTSNPQVAFYDSIVAVWGVSVVTTVLTIGLGLTACIQTARPA